MAEPKKPLSSSGLGFKAQRFKRSEVRLMGKAASGALMKPTMDLTAKEEQYKLMNAELEARTAEVVKQAEQVLREHDEVLSKPISTHLVFDIEDEELDSRTPRLSLVDDMPVDEDLGGFSLAKRIHSMEEKLDDPGSRESLVDFCNAADNILLTVLFSHGVSDAQIRLLKAKLRIMLEEMDRLSYECSKKDDESTKLSTKIKEIEEDRARLKKTTNIQQTQIEKHRALAEESTRKCDGLQMQMAGLQKELEGLNRAHKQAAGNHSTVEVRLNRALEEVERLKTQLNHTKQMNKDKVTEEHQNKENLLAENKMLIKQKVELVVGFKKQLKLIDILKRQKMHFEAAKLLSFTEEEFMKALDWGKS
ncbi:testis-expressed protein 9 [Diretmus argenteus]